MPFYTQGAEQFSNTQNGKFEDVFPVHHQHGMTVGQEFALIGLAVLCFGLPIFGVALKGVSARKRANSLNQTSPDP